jgi:preprotein translocase subunit SecD
MITILDANLTTLIAALVLLRFGTGPIRGFAVVLSLGIVVSFFTAIFVTKIIFDYFVGVKRVKKIPI